MFHCLSVCSAPLDLAAGPKRTKKPKHIFLRIYIQKTLETLRHLVSRFAPAVKPHGAFYVMSPQKVEASIALWRRELPLVRPFYAVKCNPEPLLLNTLYDAGVDFDCASERELLEIKKLARSTTTTRIIYANPCKSQRDLAAAKGLGSPTTVVDSVEEVEKLEEYGDGGALVRIAVDDSASAMPFSTKFGCQIGEVERIADAAKALRVPLRGVSFHVGSGSGGDGTAYYKAIQAAGQCLLKIRSQGHGAAETIDIGGGFLPDPADFTKKAVQIRKAIHETGPGLRWIAEPGRFFAKGAFDFFVQVIGKKGTKYTLDDSLYGQFSSILFDYAAPTWVRVRYDEDAPRQRSTGVLFGRTCDSVDVIARSESMEELRVGDWLWFPEMGAYTRATASEFNGFPTPPTMVATTIKAASPRLQEFAEALPLNPKRMPPVSARAFWGLK